MKRLSILLVAILAISINSNAREGEEYKVLWVLNNTTTANNIAEYVDATSDQAEALSDIYYTSVARLTEALTDNDRVEAQKALYYNIANVKAILSPQQYRKYLTILNATYHNQQANFDAAYKK